MTSINQRVICARSPQGRPVAEDFALETVAEQAADQGHALCETLFISLDPYLRAQLGGRHLSGSVAPGDPMTSELVCRVLEPASDGGPGAGALVRGFGHWQRRQALPVEGLSEIPAQIEPPSLALGVLGMPGLTAYAGCRRLLEPQPGDCLLVSAASGPVGATVGQLAKAAGCRVVGIAGTPEKCDWLLKEAGFDAAIDYRKESVREGLDRECPEGVDLYFDNVGGEVLVAAMERLREGARVVLCGLIEQYNMDEPPSGPNPGFIIRARATVRGLVVYDHEDLRAECVETIWQRIQSGDFAYREYVVDGLEEAPRAFVELMSGRNFGKTLVRL